MQMMTPCKGFPSERLTLTRLALSQACTFFFFYIHKLGTKMKAKSDKTCGISEWDFQSSVETVLRCLSWGLSTCATQVLWNLDFDLNASHKNIILVKENAIYFFSNLFLERSRKMQSEKCWAPFCPLFTLWLLVAHMTDLQPSFVGGDLQQPKSSHI